MRENRNKGFTLVEIMVVVAIVATISSIILISVESSRSKSRDNQRIAGIEQLKGALGFFYLENNHYPISGNCGASGGPGSGWCNSIESIVNGHWIRNESEDLTGFIEVDAVDPRPVSSPNWLPTGGGYYYYSANGGSWYLIVYTLENRNSLIEASDGVVACETPLQAPIHYGSSENSIITTGVGC